MEQNFHCNDYKRRENKKKFKNSVMKIIIEEAEEFRQEFIQETINYYTNLDKKHYLANKNFSKEAIIDICSDVKIGDRKYDYVYKLYQRKRQAQKHIKNIAEEILEYINQQIELKNTWNKFPLRNINSIRNFIAIRYATEVWLKDNNYDIIIDRNNREKTIKKELSLNIDIPIKKLEEYYYKLTDIGLISKNMVSKSNFIAIFQSDNLLLETGEKEIIYWEGYLYELSFFFEFLSKTNKGFTDNLAEKSNKFKYKIKEDYKSISAHSIQSARTEAKKHMREPFGKKKKKAYERIKNIFK